MTGDNVFGVKTFQATPTKQDLGTSHGPSSNRVSGKPAKSWEFVDAFSRTGKVLEKGYWSWKVPKIF